MKKIIVILVILIAACIVNFNLYDYDNPYEGSYKSQYGTIIKLKSNNNCIIIIEEYRDTVYFNGKYSINNNNLDIAFDKNKPDYYGVKYLKGKFEGKRLKIYDPIKNQYCVYMKE